MLEEGLKADPKDAAVHYQLGLLRFAAGEEMWSAEARAALVKAVDLAGDRRAAAALIRLESPPAGP